MKRFKTFNLIVILFALTLFITSCQSAPEPTSDSGITKVSATVEVQQNGMTIEQENVKKRLEMENRPGSIKHLYILSAYSGQVIIYSTVKGKVTSSGKRLTPKEVSAYQSPGAFKIIIGGREFYTNEVLGDDGTYGSSIQYLYWFDSKGIYHQHYLTGGQIPHISSEPMPVKSVILNMELAESTK